MNLIVFQCNVILEDVVPFLQNNLFMPRPCLCRNKLFQIANCVVLTNKKEKYKRERVCVCVCGGEGGGAKEIYSLWVR